VLSMTAPDDWVFDPFLGTGTSIIAAIRHGRRGVGAEVVSKYVDLARQRLDQEMAGRLKSRPMGKPVYDPIEAGNSLTIAPWTWAEQNPQIVLLENGEGDERYGGRCIPDSALDPRQCFPIPFFRRSRRAGSQ
jgi:adenine-specific DNA-methyltransferase